MLYFHTWSMILCFKLCDIFIHLYFTRFCNEEDAQCHPFWAHAIAIFHLWMLWKYGCEVSTWYCLHFCIHTRLINSGHCMVRRSTFNISIYSVIYKGNEQVFFDVLLTVHLGIILAIDQLNAQILVFLNKLFIFLYMFRALLCSSSVGQIALHSIWYRHALYVAVRCAGEHQMATYRVWRYQMLYNTIWPPDDEHNSARNM